MRFPCSIFRFIESINGTDDTFIGLSHYDLGSTCLTLRRLRSPVPLLAFELLLMLDGDRHIEFISFNPLSFSLPPLLGLFLKSRGQEGPGFEKAASSIEEEILELLTNLPLSELMDRYAVVDQGEIGFCLNL